MRAPSFPITLLMKQTHVILCVLFLMGAGFLPWVKFAFSKSCTASPMFITISLDTHFGKEGHQLLAYAGMKIFRPLLGESDSWGTHTWFPRKAFCQNVGTQSLVVVTASPTVPRAPCQRHTMNLKPSGLNRLSLTHGGLNAPFSSHLSLEVHHWKSSF